MRETKVYVRGWRIAGLLTDLAVDLISDLPLSQRFLQQLSGRCDLLCWPQGLLQALVGQDQCAC